MTVAEMIARRTTELTAIKDDSNAAVVSKGGTPADNLAGLPASIASIPSGGDLPSLTSPAPESDVLNGKEYIGAAGEKRTGALVVCDSVEDVEHFGADGIGVHLKIESTADGSSKTITLPEENLKSENIKSGISIFHVAGSVKEIRTETGTITTAEDSASLALPCTANPKMFVVQATDAAMDSIIADHVAAMVSAVGCWKTFPTGTAGAHADKNIAAVTIHMTSGKIGVSGVTCEVSASVTVGVYSTYRWKAGVEYQWTAYYWEDNA